MPAGKDAHARLPARRRHDLPQQLRLLPGGRGAAFLAPRPHIKPEPGPRGRGHEFPHLLAGTEHGRKQKHRGRTERKRERKRGGCRGGGTHDDPGAERRQLRRDARRERDRIGVIAQSLGRAPIAQIAGRHARSLDFPRAAQQHFAIEQERDRRPPASTRPAGRLRLIACSGEHGCPVIRGRGLMSSETGSGEIRLPILREHGPMG